MTRRSSAGAWRLTTLLREAVLNTLVAGSRLVLVAALAVLLSGADVGLHGMEMSALQQDLAALKLDGRNVILFQAADSTGSVEISRDSCEGLTGLRPVERAGLVVYAGRLTVWPIGDSVPVFRVSGSLVPGLTVSDALIGPELDNGAIRPVVRLGDVARSAIFGTHQPQGVPLNSAVAVSLNPAELYANECVVVLEDTATAAGMLPVLQAELDTQGSQVVGIIAGDSTERVIDSFLSRPTQYSYLAVGLLGGLIVALTTRSRRGEIATYLLSGSSASSIRLLLVLESAIFAAIALASSLTFQIVVTAPQGDELILIALRSSGLALAWLIASALSALAITGRPIDLSKERT